MNVDVPIQIPKDGEMWWINVNHSLQGHFIISIPRLHGSFSSPFINMFRCSSRLDRHWRLNKTWGSSAGEVWCEANKRPSLNERFVATIGESHSESLWLDLDFMKALWWLPLNHEMLSMSNMHNVHQSTSKYIKVHQIYQYYFASWPLGQSETGCCGHGKRMKKRL